MADATQLYRAIGLELSQTMGGSSGVLLAISSPPPGTLRRTAPTRWTPSRPGSTGFQQVGGARPGDRTMIDALFPATRGPPRARGGGGGRAQGGGRDRHHHPAKAAGRPTSPRTSSPVNNDPGAEAVARDARTARRGRRGRLSRPVCDISCRGSSSHAGRPVRRFARVRTGGRT